MIRDKNFCTGETDDFSVVYGDNNDIGLYTVIGDKGFRYGRSDDGTWVEMPHNGRVLIGNNVSIGSFVSICRGTDRDTVIGEGTKIDNHVHIAHNVQVGKNVLIGAGAIIGGSCTIEDGAIIKMGEVIPAHTTVKGDSSGDPCNWDLPTGKKLLITDLDDTLWEGVLADETPVVVYAEYAKQLKELADAGILLAICTRHPKTEERFIGDIFDEVMERSGVTLRLSDFVLRIGGIQDKAECVKEIIERLNLLPESSVFIDDSPHERDWVARNIPGLTVCDDLDMTMFKTADLTIEDKNRLRMYKEEQQRQARRVKLSHEEWVGSLGIQLDYDTGIEPRVFQLLNKTNQMKLNGRKYPKGAESDVLTFRSVRMRDNFGDYGIVAVLVVNRYYRGEEDLIDFCLSCRAMGRGVEEKIFNHHGPFRKIEFQDTGRNKPMKDFLVSRGLL
jgi:FkbH-like protein